jgi:hypothetical protein
LASSSVTDLWRAIADEATAESPLWGEALLPEDEREHLPVFSPLGEQQYALGLETIYEGYLLHYGRPRLFAPPDRDTSLLVGDYLYAHGLVRVAAYDDADAVADLAALISLCAQFRADGTAGDGEAWAATAALLGNGPLSETHDPAALAALAGGVSGDEAVARALAVHRTRVG